MATGDISSAEVLALADFNSNTDHVDGWVLKLVIEGRGGETLADLEFDMDGDGTYSNSLSDLDNAAIVLSLTSEGYTGTTLGTTSRTVYGTRVLRRLDPNDADLELASVNAGADLAVYIALSDYVFADDTSVTVDVAANFCRRATGSVNLNNAATGLSVTNSSTVVYPKPVAGWNIVHKYRYWDPSVDGDFTVSICAAHMFPKNGEQIAAAVFTFTDGTNTVSKTVTASTLSSLYAQETTNGTRVVEYATTFSASDVSGFTDGDCEIRCQVYPHIGDAASILDTGTTRGAGPSSTFQPFEVLLDEAAGINPPVYAYVDVGNAGASPAVSETRSAVVGDATTAYADVRAASAAIAGYINSNYSINAVTNGVIVIADNASVSPNDLLPSGFWGSPSGAKCWTTIEPENAGQVTITGGTGNSSGDYKIHYLRLKGINHTITTGNWYWFGGGSGFALWLDGCTGSYNNNGNTFYNWDSGYYATDLDVTAFQPEPAASTSYTLYRGCKIVNTSTNDLRQRPGVFGCLFQNIYLSSATDGADDDNRIFAFNKFLSISSTSPFGVCGATANDADGIAFVQNVVEKTNATQAGLNIGGDGSDSSATGARTNIIVHNNTIMGGRANVFYNDDGTDPRSAPVRRLISWLGNIMFETNIKDDQFTSSPLTIGNQNAIYGVGFKRSINYQHTSGFDWDYDGLRAFDGTWSVVFEDDGSSATYIGDGTGNGDYRLATAGEADRTAISPFRALNWDLEGNSRSGTDYAGAYTLGAPALTLPTDTSTGATTGSGTVTTSGADGTLYAVVTTSSTAPSAAQVKLGQDNSGSAAADSDSQVISASGLKSFTFTGLTANTNYWAYYMHEDAAAAQSAVASANGFFTTSGTVTLTSASASPTGQTTADLDVNTPMATGTMYWTVTDEATAGGSDVKGGFKDDGVTAAAASGSFAVSAAGAQTTVNVTGLTAGTTYYAHFYHENADATGTSVSHTSSFATYPVTPTLSGASLGLVNPTSLRVSVTTDDPTGEIWWVLTQSATPPSAAQVKAGQNDGGTAADAANTGSPSGVALSAYSYSATATGLSDANTYYVHFVQDDGEGTPNTSSVASSTGVVPGFPPNSGGGLSLSMALKL